MSKNVEFMSLLRSYTTLQRLLGILWDAKDAGANSVASVVVKNAETLIKGFQHFLFGF